MLTLVRVWFIVGYVNPGQSLGYYLYIRSCLVGGVGFSWGSPSPSGVRGCGVCVWSVCGVCVECVWSVCGRGLVEAASPGLSPADWTLGLGQAAHLW